MQSKALVQAAPKSPLPGGMQIPWVHGLLLGQSALVEHWVVQTPREPVQTHNDDWQSQWFSHAPPYGAVPFSTHTPSPDPTSRHVKPLGQPEPLAGSHEVVQKAVVSPLMHTPLSHMDIPQQYSPRGMLWPRSSQCV